MSPRAARRVAATFLAAAPLDVINHRVNGLDLTAWSPTHMLLYIGTGVMQAAEIAERVTNVFYGLGPRAVMYGASSIGPGEAGDKDGNWFRLPVTIEFQYQVPPSEPEPQP